MGNGSLTGVRACVFDAYGTLFDFAAAAKGCRDVLGNAIDPLTALWRDKQLQYTWLRALQGRHADFWQVTGDALDFALETLAIEKPGLRDRLMNLYLTLDAFPEVVDVLRRLKKAGQKTAILSNGSPAMLDAAVKAPSSTRCSTRFSPSKKSESTNPTRKSISLPLIGSVSLQPPLHSSRRMHGTLTRPRPLACGLYGAIAMANAPSDYPALQTGQ